MELAITIIFCWFLYLLVLHWSKKIVALFSDREFTQSSWGQFLYSFIIPLILAASAGFLWG